MLVKEKVEKYKAIDSSFALLKDGYLFIKKRADKNQSNIFETRLLGEKVICITGEEGAKLFYNPELFQRKGAAPKRVQKTLIGENPIQTMDGQAHIHRKHLFMSLMGKEHQKTLGELVKNKLELSIDKWQNKEKIILFDEMKEILCEAACNWAGVPLHGSEIKVRAEDFSWMVDAFGAVGPRYWKGKIAREKAEQWIEEIIEDVRAGKLKVQQGSPLYEIAFHKNLNGSLMDTKMAAIELINVLRPIVAIATFITFAALALYEHPSCKEKLLLGDEDYIDMFAQEVRRYYPFAPFLGARAKKDFIFNGFQFEEGMLVILDIYGTNHDSKVWEKPNEFYPERFKKQKGSLFDFIPQGGGDAAKTHRCPGEGITIEIMKEVINFLVNKIDFQVPEQDLAYSMKRIPTLPESGFIITSIKRKYKK